MLHSLATADKAVLVGPGISSAYWANNLAEYGQLKHSCDTHMQTCIHDCTNSKSQGKFIKLGCKPQYHSIAFYTGVLERHLKPKCTLIQVG